MTQDQEVLLCSSPPPIERPGRRSGRLAQWCWAPHSWSGCDAAGTTARRRRARRPMQVQCSKCSQLIALSDIIESAEGRLSHVNCAQPRTLTIDERTLLFVYCGDHVVAQCLACGLSFRVAELGADPLGGDRAYQCPRCRKALTENVRTHVYGCARLPSEVRCMAQAVRVAAQHRCRSFALASSNV